MLLYRFEKDEPKRIESLENGKLWMSLPSVFNDPLDCRLKLDDKTDMSTFKIERLKSAARELYQQYGESGWRACLLDESVIAKIQEWIDDPDNFYGQHPDGTSKNPPFLDLIEQKIKGFGIQCFSEVCDSPLMWSHYANVHTSFCIEYECNQMDVVSRSNGDFSIFPAIYTSQLPEFTLNEVLFTPDEVTSRLIATKSDHWSYEREHRLVFFPCSAKERGQSVDLPEGLKVKSIIAGINTKSETLQRLQAAASKLGVAFEQMQRANRYYSLVRTPYEYTLENPDKAKFDQAKSIFVAKITATKLGEIDPESLAKIKGEMSIADDVNIIEVTFEQVKSLKGDVHAANTLLATLSSSQSLGKDIPITPGGEYLFLLSNEHDVWEVCLHKVFGKYIPKTYEQLNNFSRYATASMNQPAKA